jgi:hypothetical protein
VVLEEHFSKVKVAPPLRARRRAGQKFFLPDLLLFQNQGKLESPYVDTCPNMAADVIRLLTYRMSVPHTLNP